ncbi:hypothetical protein AB4090_11780 [Acidithiobacillus sp. IBUN Pt1247-S3]|uniref:hypothetical protein n=1 Tax=Acidithiobacillus sp. IBUN Pt1247-S3 TaxID=3166642 RepID=UPI0034E4D4AF
MLKTCGDAQYRYLDMREAEPGDRFFHLRHQPYSDVVSAIESVEVVTVDDKTLHCRVAGQSKLWKLRRQEEQIHCYVAEDPLFQQLYYTFIRAQRIQQVQDWIRHAPPERFDEEVLQAIEHWHGQK